MSRFGIRTRNGLVSAIIQGEAGTSIDADAQAYFDRVTAAGGSLTLTEKDAVNILTLSLKSNGLWTLMKAIYPMVGASAAACAQNLKSSSFTGSFTSGWTFASSGVTPNGTSAYMDTGFNMNTELTDNINNHISYYSRSQNTGINAYDIGVYDGANEYASSLYYAATASKLFTCYVYPAQAITVNNTNTLGLLIGTRTSGTLSRHYFNGTILGSNTASIGGNVRPTFNIWVGAKNNQNSIAQASTRECAFASIGLGLNDTQASNFYSAVNTFQTTLTRNV